MVGTQDAVEGLVLESAAANQAEWMQMEMEMRERSGSRRPSGGKLHRMVARWNDVYLVC